MCVFIVWEKTQLLVFLWDKTEPNIIIFTCIAVCDKRVVWNVDTQTVNKKKKI